MFRTTRRLIDRYGRWPRLVLAALCVLAAVGSAATRHRQQSGAATTTVLVARRDLPIGRVLTAHDLRRTAWPAALPLAGGRRDLRAVVGRRLASPVAAGEPVTADRLVGRDLVTGLRAGQLALPVLLADAQAADILHPGDRVELLALARSDAADGLVAAGSAGAADGAAVSVARAVLVLAVLPDATADQAGSSEGGTEIVVAADRPTALRVARAAQTQDLAALAEPP